MFHSILRNADKQNLYFSGNRLALFNNLIGPVAKEHNLYGAKINKGVISGNYWMDPNVDGLRITGNHPPGSWNIVVSENRFSNSNGPSISLKLTNYNQLTGGHNILIERNYINDCVSST